MPDNPKTHLWLTAPNLLTLSRLFAAPLLILTAALGYRNLFLTLFALFLATDAFDGYLARKLNQTSELGTKLDGWADLSIWAGAFVCLWILWPDIAARETPYALFALFAFSLPMLVGYIKYKSVPSYHCYSAKLQAILISTGAFILLLSGISWPFRLAAILQGFAAAEDIAITLVLPTCRYNVPSFRQALKISRQSSSGWK